MSDFRQVGEHYRSGPLAELPKLLADWIRGGGATIIDKSGGDWEVRLGSPSGRAAGEIPQGALEIARNGMGDFLFLSPDQLGVLGETVFVYWHESSSVEVFDEIGRLIAPPSEGPSDSGQIFYHGSDAPVRLNDVVELRVCFLLRRVGVVTYVPGVSKKDVDMEHHGLTWVGIRTTRGEQVSEVVFPETSRLKKSVRLIRRGGVS